MNVLEKLKNLSISENNREIKTKEEGMQMPPPRWEWVTLDKLGSFETGNPWNSKFDISHSLNKNKGIPFVDGGTISQSKLHILGDKFYDPKYLPSKIKIFPKDTVCFVCVGSYPGESSILKTNGCISNNIYAFNSCENISFPKFFKYSLDFSDIKKKIFISSSTTTPRKALSRHKLLSIKFPCPPLNEQYLIGNTLSAYDELIENNERQIEVLQGIRTSIFKEWFVNLRFPENKGLSLNDLISAGGDELLRN
ncbi:restriction endonuclease subunit S [Mycoplasma suis]|uniref:Type I restriction-modification system specificity subunit n=2 Tax=Mycoplasma suis TaxID=57372 RepID=F0QS48_MYCSL|nr:restriction endonuclease subunit S [Mycoplasma suis]ADX98318.1 type I restriction-modification system specificity subunit [Mycoplasma suis str. Illinois]CBZ40833.1 Restriction modification system DNA (specificity subunit), probably fragment [Mycoplasma suis KI3806]